MLFTFPMQRNCKGNPGVPMKNKSWWCFVPAGSVYPDMPFEILMPVRERTPIT